MCGAVSDIDACVPALRRHASLLLRDRRDIDRLVHACLTKALDHTAERPMRADHQVWLFAIMYDLLAKRPWRGRLRRPGAAEGRDGHDALRALDQLAEQQRMVLLLVTIEDLTYTQVAQILRLSVAAVLSLLAAGRENLRRIDAGAGDAGLPGMT